jgi:hypothetical protein
MSRAEKSRALPGFGVATAGMRAALFDVSLMRGTRVPVPRIGYSDAVG